MKMSKAITKCQERYIEERLVEIIVEPEEYGIEEARTHRESVVKVLMEIVNKAFDCKLTKQQVAEVYDRIMDGNIEQTILNYFQRNLHLITEVCTSIYYKMADYNNLFLMLNKKAVTDFEIKVDSSLNRKVELMNDTLECLEGAMINLEGLSGKNGVFRMIMQKRHLSSSC